MSAGQYRIHSLAVQPVEEAFLPRSKRKISSSDRAVWQKPGQQDIRAKMHMMMTVDTGRILLVEAAKLVKLGRNYILKGLLKSRMVKNLGQTMAG